MMIIFWYVILIASITSYIALSKNYNPYKWFIIGATTGIIGLFIIFKETNRKNESIH